MVVRESLDESVSRKRRALENELYGCGVDDLRALRAEEARDGREYLLPEQRKFLRQYEKIGQRPPPPRGERTMKGTTP